MHQPILIVSLCLALTVPVSGAQTVSASRALAGFVENCGQWDEQVSFGLRRPSGVVGVGAQALALTLPAGALASEPARERMTVRLGSAKAGALAWRPVGAPLPGVVHDLVGSNAEHWSVGARLHPKLSAVDVRGVRWNLTTTADGLALSWRHSEPNEVVVELGLDGLARWQAAPADSPDLASVAADDLQRLALTGDARARRAATVTPAGATRITLPPALPGEESELEVELVWASFLGASLGDGADGVAFGPSGEVGLAGTTISLDFPVTPGVVDPLYELGPFGGSNTEAYVAVFEPDGSTLRFATFLGGDNGESVAGLGFAADGSVVVAGQTASVDFPVTTGPEYAFGDGFVSRLDPSGASFVWSRLVGASQPEGIEALVVHESGDVTVAGWTMSPEFPHEVAIGPDPPGFNTEDCFVARLAGADGSFEWSTLYGGSGADEAKDLAIGPDGRLAVLTSVGISDLVLTDDAFNVGPVFGGRAVFVLGADGATLEYATYYDWPGTTAVTAVGLAHDRLVLAGFTSYADLPTTPGVFQMSKAPFNDGFLHAFDLSTGEVAYATYLGAGADDTILDLHLSPSGVVTVVGTTRAPDFPTTPGAFQPAVLNSLEISLFVSRLEPRAERLVYSTIVGGSDDDFLPGTSLAVGASSAVVVGTSTRSVDFPVTPDAYDPDYDGNGDAAVIVLPLLPEGVERFGTSSGPAPTIGAIGRPDVGSGRFGLTCDDAAPGTMGALLVGTAGLLEPLVLAGAPLWVQPSGLQILAGVPGADGWVEVWTAIPDLPALVGQSLVFQYAWPAAGGGLVTSHALRVTILD